MKFFTFASIADTTINEVQKSNKVRSMIYKNIITNSKIGLNKAHQLRNISKKSPSCRFWPFILGISFYTYSFLLGIFSLVFTLCLSIHFSTVMKILNYKSIPVNIEETRSCLYFQTRSYIFSKTFSCLHAREDLQARRLNALTWSCWNIKHCTQLKESAFLVSFCKTSFMYRSPFFFK